jgi:hypothetical protein
MNWGTTAAQFVILLVITFDLLPKNHSAKLTVLTTIVLVVLFIASVKVALDLKDELKKFKLAKGVSTMLTDIIQARCVEQILGMPVPHVSRDDELEFGVEREVLDEHLCPKHVKKLKRVCRDLLELKWIKGPDAKFPQSEKALLRSPKIRESKYYIIANTFISLKNEEDPKYEPALTTATLLYVLHEACQSEIDKIRCKRAAKKKAIELLHKSIETKTESVLTWAQAEAKKIAIQEAKERIEMNEKSQGIVVGRRKRGMDTPDLPEPERWLTLKFSLAATGKCSVAGRLTKSGREIIEPQVASGTIVVSGEVGIKWDEDQTVDGLDESHATVNEVTHQISEPSAPVHDDREGTPSRRRRSSSGDSKNSEITPLNDDEDYGEDDDDEAVESPITTGRA